MNKKLEQLLQLREENRAKRAELVKENGRLNNAIAQARHREKTKKI
jgi:hypothetical protein